jgi:hypothetical protein
LWTSVEGTTWMNFEPTQACTMPTSEPRNNDGPICSHDSRLRPMRGFKTLAGARLICRAHAFLRNLRAGFYDLGRRFAADSPQPPVVRA